MNIRIRVLAAIVVVGVLLTFVLQNWQATQMQFLGWRLPMLPLAV